MFIRLYRSVFISEIVFHTLKQIMSNFMTCLRINTHLLEYQICNENNKIAIFIANEVFNRSKYQLKRL